jgi:hypothetical protein
MTVLDATGDAYVQVAARPWLRLGARKVLPWAGLLLVLLLSSLTTDQAGRAPIQRAWVYGQLNQAHTFGQTFVVERDALVAVRVLLFAGPTNRDDPITLRLHYAGSDLPDLARVTLPLRTLDRHVMTTFAIPALTQDLPPQTLTTTLRLDLEAPTLEPSDWAIVMAGPDTYPDGELFVDGKARPVADLAFQPIYRRRWFDMLLPISRMAHGKPGPLGWPQLYVLLAYIFCLALAWALRQFQRIAMWA